MAVAGLRDRLGSRSAEAYLEGRGLGRFVTTQLRGLNALVIHYLLTPLPLQVAKGFGVHPRDYQESAMDAVVSKHRAPPTPPKYLYQVPWGVYQLVVFGIC